MKKLLIFTLASLFTLNLSAQELKTIQLNAHSKVRGSNVMEAFQNRQSSRAYQATNLSLQDLSDVLWAANGINRPESGKKTAPSAMNSQDVDIYVCRADGAFLYDATSNTIKQVITQDIRPIIEGHRPSGAPLILLLVSDMSRYKNYQPDSIQKNKSLYEMGCLDAGIVSQNIAICCAGIGLGTVPRAGMDQKGIRNALKLKDSQALWLNLPVGYPKK
jgi:nitroreductase